MNKQLFNSSKEIRQDKLGRLLVYSALTVVLVLALAMLYFIFSKGIATFTQNHINFWDFLTRSNWNTDNLQKPDLGAWALMVTSAETTLLAVLVTTPLALVIAIYIVVMSPKIGGANCATPNRIAVRHTISCLWVCRTHIANSVFT